MNTKPLFTDVPWYANLLKPVQSEIRQEVRQDASGKEWDMLSEADAFKSEHHEPNYPRVRKGAQKALKRRKYR